MCEAFLEGAREAGHDVEILHVGKMKIAGCLAGEENKKEEKLSAIKEMAKKI